MKLLLAPDGFKGSLSAREAAQAMARGARRAVADAVCDVCPLADGGEGTVAAFLDAGGGERRTARVRGPLGGQQEAGWALVDEGRTAVIEMSAAAGLELVAREHRDPHRTTTYGVGELIAAALDAMPERIVVGLGGSATCDGGIGMAQALGLRAEGSRSERLRGGDLLDLDAVDPARLDPRLRGVELVAACDVDNPLLGEQGAAPMYAPQKGADEQGVRALARGLEHLAELVARSRAAGAEGWPPVRPRGEPLELPREPRELQRILADIPGAGAAGGLGFGLVALCGARIVPGAALVLERARFAERLRGADLVLTGEGRLDGQSLRGKVVATVARAAREAGVPAIALAGSLGAEIEGLHDAGLTACFAAPDGPLGLDEALARAAELLERLAENVVRAFRAG